MAGLGQFDPRTLMEHRPFTPPSVSVNPAKLQAVAAMLGPIPGLGDVAGLAADAAMYATDPESRKLRNYLLTGLGVLPFVPAVASLGKATRNVPTGFGNEIGAIGDWRGPVYHYTSANVTPEELRASRGAIFTSTDPRAAMYGAASGRNEYSLGMFDMSELNNPKPIGKSSMGREGDRILPMHYRGAVYGVTIPERIGPIELPEKITDEQYSELLDKARSLQVPGLGENAITKARQIAVRTIKAAYDDNGVRQEVWPIPKRGSPDEFDWKSFEGRFYPDAQNTDGSSAVISALKALGFNGAALADEGSILDARSIAIFDKSNLKSIFSP